MRFFINENITIITSILLLQKIITIFARFIEMF